ncbi:MAG: hypothetical protein ABW179_11720, partial [Methylobacterium sp.]
MVFRIDLRRCLPVNDIMQSPVSDLVAGLACAGDRWSIVPFPWSKRGFGPSKALKGIPPPSKRGR